MIDHHESPDDFVEYSYYDPSWVRRDGHTLIKICQDAIDSCRMYIPELLIPDT